MMDYIKWRGDIPFSAVPLCEVDGLIFSKMTFVDLQDVLPSYGSGLTMTVGEAAYRYLQDKDEKTFSLGLLQPKEIFGLFSAMGKSERYRHLLLSDYVNIIDTELQKQFSAVTVFLSTDEMFIAFRGTDDTLVGWKENFNMSHTCAVPAQLEAVRYVDAVMERCPHSRVWLGGHSKGGNLAIYAAVHCREEYKDRIVRVFNNDGPGFSREMVESAAYQEMDSRILTIVPQGSVVGRLLEHEEQCRVVHSNATGLWQHNGFSWEVSGGGFVSEPELTRESRMIEQSIKTWVASMDEQGRESFVDALYRFLTATNASTLTELTSDRAWLLRLMRESDPDAKKAVFGGLAQLTGEAGRLWAETILPFFYGKTAFGAKGNDAKTTGGKGE